MGLLSLWHRITGNYEPVESIVPTDYGERLSEIERQLDMGKRELGELAARVRVAEIALGVKPNGSEQDG